MYSCVCCLCENHSYELRIVGGCSWASDRVLFSLHFSELSLVGLALDLVH